MPYQMTKDLSHGRVVRLALKQDDRELRFAEKPDGLGKQLGRPVLPPAAASRVDDDWS